MNENMLDLAIQRELGTLGRGRRWAASLACVFSILLVVLQVGCDQAQPDFPAIALPGPDAVLNSWSPAGEVRVFDRDDLYDLVDGMAEAFFAYGFEQVAVRDYEHAEGGIVGVEVWRLATPADAYGLFTASASSPEGTPVDVGNDGDGDPGRRLAFWQDRYYVLVRARQQVPEADLQALAEVVSVALPSGGEQPALVSQLPPEGMVERSVVFFREEISIQSNVWLGGENVLGLSQDTDGVLARYEINDALVFLMLVQYPDEGAAADALVALESGPVADVIAADVRGEMLGAVLGGADPAAAGRLLAQALGGT
jgi:hypothetical protein